MDIHKLIAALNPEVYCQPGSRRRVKRILNNSMEKGDSVAYLEAAEVAVPVEPNHVAVTQLELVNPFQLPGFISPTTRHQLTYDSMEDSLEAFYFSLLSDLENDRWQLTKLMDTFQAAPGSGVFGEMTRREGRAQQDLLRLWREAQSLVSYLVREVGDLKARRRHSDEGSWDLDSHADPGLLRSKLELLKLHAHWLGPYLSRVQHLEPKGRGGPDLVSIFNTAVAEVSILASRDHELKTAVDQGDLPRMFLKNRHRGCREVLLIELRFRAAPDRTDPGAYAYRGRADVTMTSYALNDDEIAALQGELDRQNMQALVSASGKAGSALGKAIAELEHSLVPEAVSKSTTRESNPFTALFDFRSTFGNNGRAEAGEGGPRTVRSDSEIEAVIRSHAILEARRQCDEVYDRCKAAWGMVGLEAGGV